MEMKPKPAADRLVSIVDDDASIRRSTRRFLSSLGLRAEAFGSAAEFLRSGYLVETDCLLLDLNMPGMGGLELQRRLAETGSRIPIVFLTARATEEEEGRALRAGAVGFLRKPVDQATLLRAINTALALGPGYGECAHPRRPAPKTRFGPAPRVSRILPDWRVK